MYGEMRNFTAPLFVSAYQVFREFLCPMRLKEVALGKVDTLILDMTSVFWLNDVFWLCAIKIRLVESHKTVWSCSDFSVTTTKVLKTSIYINLSIYFK